MTDGEFKHNLERFAKFLDRTYEDQFTEYATLKAEIAVTDEPVPWSKRKSLKYRPVTEGERWGGIWQSAWLHLTGTVPKAWKGQPFALRLNLGGEALLFEDDGTPHWSFTDYSVFFENYRKDTYRFAKPAKGGEKLDLWVEATSNHLFGAILQEEPHATRNTAPEGTVNPVITHLRVALFNEELYHYRIEFENLRTLLAGYYQPTDYRAKRLMAILNRACDAYREDPARAALARAELKPALQCKAADSALTVTAVGHAHIDVGWLWPVRESIRKAARTYASQLLLMDRFPGYVFGGSQPQLYAFVKENYPALYQRIKKRVKEGRWECQGGMWVEADCNLTSGESLVRQFLHGKNFFMDEFGVDVRNLWIPDVFGYAATLPQIIKLCGCNSFVTQKISWNQINHFPFNSFRWKGIDGTEVVTHFPPENSYNSGMLADGLAKAQDNYNEAGVHNEFLCLYGIGDGGGGPKEDYVERAVLNQDLDGVPHVKMGRAQDFLDRLVAQQDALPVWSGELYLEMHRGTLTTQARTKRNNRKLEQRLALAEFILSSLPAKDYPREVLDRIWKKLLLNQFHDILPGSSIVRVYQVTEKEHTECLAEAAKLVANAGKKLLKKDADAVTFVNTLSTDYTRPIELPADWAKAKVTLDGKAVPTQVEKDGRVFALATLPADSWTTLKRVAAKAAPAAKADAKLVLENDVVRYEFSQDGRVVSAKCAKTGAALLAGEGNVLNLYADFPTTYDAWDVEVWLQKEYIESAHATAKAVRESGAVRSALRFRLAIGNSTIEQEVSLAPGSARLEFHTVVDWHEERKMLRVLFPTPVQTTEATYDIQYGYLKRPTHANTSWEAAKFECCGQRYVDLSDTQNGVALLNDCKYGHRIQGSTIELGLLRSPKFPDYHADQGRQEFTYALLPHQGTLVDANVGTQAAQLNREPWRFDGLAGAIEAPVSVTGQGVSLEVLKRAEKSDALVVRIVETLGQHSTGALRLAKSAKLKKVTVTNAIEWTDEGELKPGKDGAYPLDLKPFQILTLKLQ